MTPTDLQHRRTHNLLLISKLLNQRDASSPFTLVLDNLEQSGNLVLAEYMKRAIATKVRITFVSFETLCRPQNAVMFIEAWKQGHQAWQRELESQIKTQQTQKTLVVFDSLNMLANMPDIDLPGLLSSFMGPSVSLLAIYHTDIPISVDHDAYSPTALAVLKYLATTIFTVHSLHHILARKAARERSHAEPFFGLETGMEGVLHSLGANCAEGLVLEMEHRRRSGRGVEEWYYLPRQTMKHSTQTSNSKPRESAILLEDHPAYRTREEAAAGQNLTGAEITFELGLTEKQRQDREGIVLPYFDAQTGGGDGGRILYDMGEEDDFDEEEDEI